MSVQLGKDIICPHRIRGKYAIGPTTGVIAMLLAACFAYGPSAVNAQEGSPQEQSLDDGDWLLGSFAMDAGVPAGAAAESFDERGFSRVRVPGEVHLQVGQFLITVLIANGITGVKGYIDEPLLQAIASPSVTMARYTSGFTLPESFYAGSRFVGWEDVVIGAPWHKRRHG